MLDITDAALPTNPDIQGMTVCPSGVAAGAVQSDSAVNDGPDGSVAVVVLELTGTAEIPPITGCGTMLTSFSSPPCASAGDLLIVDNQTIAATTVNPSPGLVCNDNGAGEPFVLYGLTSSDDLELPVASDRKILFEIQGEELVVTDTQPFPTETTIIGKASDIANCTSFLGSYSISSDGQQVVALCNDSPNTRQTIQQIPAGGGSATQVLATESTPTGPFDEVLGVISDLQFAGNSSLAFRGGGFDGTNFVDVAWHYGLGGPLTATVARGDPVPGTTGGVVIDVLGGVSADEEYVVVDVFGSDSNGYVLRHGPLSGTPTTTQLAGPTGTFVTDLAADATACGEGYQMWFFADASNSGWAGLAIGGSPEILIDESTVLPGGDTPAGFNTGAACDFDAASGHFEGLFNVTTVGNPTDPLIVHVSGQTGDATGPRGRAEAPAIPGRA